MIYCAQKTLMTPKAYSIMSDRSWLGRSGKMMKCYWFLASLSKSNKKSKKGLNCPKFKYFSAQSNNEKKIITGFSNKWDCTQK